MPLTLSWYHASIDTPVYPALSGRQQTDVCVICGGYTGLSAALELAEAGRRVILLEAEQPGWGCSGRNGGQINPGLACDHSVLERALGKEDALKVWQLSLDGVQLIQQRAARHAIECDLTAGILLVANRPRHVPELRAWQQQLERLGYARLRFHERTALGQLLQADYQAGVLDEGGGSLHPLKYALGLARAAQQAGAIIHGQSRVSHISQNPAGVTVTTAAGQVQADQVIIGGNAYSGGLLPWRHRRFIPIGSYIGATCPLSALAEQLIPSRAPQFGYLGNRVLYAQGYSGQGVALAGLAGKLMAEAVIGRSEGFDLLARLRHRPVPPGTTLQTAIRALALGWYALLDRRG